ncbi:MAG TPA: site-specific integrase, partial [Lysobacter sp.]
MDVVAGAVVVPAIEEFLAHLAVERRMSPNTLDAYRRDLTALSQWASGHDQPDLLQL